MNDLARNGHESNLVPRKKKQSSADKPVGLKVLGDYLGLHPVTDSVVLNNVPGRSIPVETSERVSAAARKFNYQPNLLTRSPSACLSLTGTATARFGMAAATQPIGQATQALAVTDAADQRDFLFDGQLAQQCFDSLLHLRGD